MTRILNFKLAPQQGISAGNGLMSVNAGVAVAARAQNIGVQTVLDRRPMISRDLHKVVEAKHADILRAHRVIIGCRGSDSEMLVVDTAGDVPSGSGKISLVGQRQTS